MSHENDVHINLEKLLNRGLILEELNKWMLIRMKWSWMRWENMEMLIYP